MIDLDDITRVAEVVREKPRKVSAPTPNVANTVEAALAPLLALLPDEVCQSAHVWISGSRVSSTVLGWAQKMDNSVDLDVFVTDGSAYAWLRAAFEAMDPLGVRPFKERPAENRSHARGVGFKVELACGLSVDVWYETTDPVVQLQLYPADGYAHVRMAYNPLRRALIVVANEAAP